MENERNIRAVRKQFMEAEEETRLRLRDFKANLDRLDDPRQAADPENRKAYLAGLADGLAFLIVSPTDDREFFDFVRGLMEETNNQELWSEVIIKLNERQTK
jgi:hypothetical protein